MAFTFGFYNSLNHDRKYNAIQMGQIFDGIIYDGVYSTVGKCFVVRATELEQTVVVGTGRAWFDHTWNYNDSDMVLEAPQSDILMNRIDAVVIDVWSDESRRSNEIKWVMGTPSSNPSKPVLLKQLGHSQYPLAYVLRRAGVETISQADITSTIGTTECPFVTGPLEHVTIDNLLLQWEAQWDDYYNAQVADMDATSELWKQQWNEFYALYTEQMESTKEEWDDQWATWFDTYTETNSATLQAWMTEQKEIILAWFDELQDILDENTAVNLANEILALKKRADKLEAFDHVLSNEFAVYNPIDDSDDDPILDENDKPIEGRIIFEIKRGGELCV